MSDASERPISSAVAGFNLSQPSRGIQVGHESSGGRLPGQLVSGDPGVDTSTLADLMRRPLRDLRVSVTDRCNLRCTYCMPRDVFNQKHIFLRRADLLSFEEVERLANLFIGLGVQKIRLTGGEPLLRKGIEHLVEKLAKLNDSSGTPIDLAMTTNALLLSGKAKSLKDAGLSRISVSLDGLSNETYQRMSDSEGSVSTVLEGIATARRVGFADLKVNMVLKRGVNDHEIIPMAEHFRNSGVILRFIEYMDVGNSNGWRMDDVIPAREVLDRVHRMYPLEALEPTRAGEVAKRWQYVDGSGEIGVIASVTQAFCRQCTRARLSTDGKLYTCLFATQGLDLRSPLRLGADDHALGRMIEECWRYREDRYSELRSTAQVSSARKIEMSYIGG